MIDRLEIRNFKSIVEAKLDFGRVNIFIGANGSGKSNILEAIGVLSAALGRGVTPGDLDLRGVRLSLPRLFKSTFKYRRIPQTLRLEARCGAAAYAIGLRAGDAKPTLEFHTEKVSEFGRKLIGRSPHGIRIHAPSHKSYGEMRHRFDDDRGVWEPLRQLTDVSPETLASFSILQQYRIYTPQTALMRGLTTDPRDGQVGPLGLTGGRLAAALSEISMAADTVEKDQELHTLLSIIWEPGWADLVRVGKHDPDIVPANVPTLPQIVYMRDKFMHGGRDFLSAHDASEGTLYLMFVAALLAHAGAPSVFALDNVDGTLNPRLVRKLVEHIVHVVCGSEDEEPLSDRCRQVFLTSHNPTALDALDIFNPDHRIFVVSRDTEKRKGATIVKPLLPPEGMTKARWIEARQGKNLSQLWLDDAISGALG